MDTVVQIPIPTVCVSSYSLHTQLFILKRHLYLRSLNCFSLNTSFNVWLLKIWLFKCFLCNIIVIECWHLQNVFLIVEFDSIPNMRYCNKTTGIGLNLSLLSSPMYTSKWITLILQLKKWKQNRGFECSKHIC